MASTHAPTLIQGPVTRRIQHGTQFHIDSAFHLPVPAMVDNIMDVPEVFTGTVTDRNGDHATYHDGQLNSVNGEAALVTHNEQRWYMGGKMHREDGPFLIATGKSPWEIFALNDYPIQKRHYATALADWSKANRDPNWQPHANWRLE